jgi:hypothetical protein
MKEVFQRWETKTRYYTVYLRQDLFCEWILERSWGGRYNRRGGEKVVLCSSYQDGLGRIEKLYKLKQKHRYEVIL